MKRTFTLATTSLILVSLGLALMFGGKETFGFAVVLVAALVACEIKEVK